MRKRRHAQWKDKRWRVWWRDRVMQRFYTKVSAQAYAAKFRRMIEDEGI